MLSTKTCLHYKRNMILFGFTAEIGKALGLTVPPSQLAQADDMIEKGRDFSFCKGKCGGAKSANSEAGAIVCRPSLPVLGPTVKRRRQEPTSRQYSD